MELIHKDLTDAILNAFFDVYNESGYGFLEKVYQNSMMIELKIRGFNVVAQKPVKVYYKGAIVGDYYADIVVENLVILELKATDVIVEGFEWQLENYLGGTEMEVGLLLNFGKKPEFRRKVFMNSRKNIER